ncbi:serine protease snake-like isoform X2 [Zophobas morio]|uniref:serine protease snake-like isoform X2 n=1 Tax=Zophobas morio TaxID=2755281 RepID=UPI0030833A9C
MHTVLSLFTAIFLGAVYCQKFIDDTCTIKSTGAKGVCTLFANCEKAREDLKYNRFPHVCGFQETQPIVCCPQSQNVTRETSVTEKNAPVARKPGEISRRKCEEYSQYVYEILVPPTGLVGQKPVKKYECGHQVTKLIVGGDPAGRKEFPHMAAIGYNSSDEGMQWLCGGSILSSRYVLTAAHCLCDVNAGKALWVRVGVTKLNDTSYHRQQIRIADRILHPEYRENSFYHDIALLRLERDVTLNLFSRPACLYLKSKIMAVTAIATGWGHTDFAGSTSNDLLKVMLDLYNETTCSRFYENERTLPQGILDNLHICAGSVEGHNDTCQGDSGGPLQIFHSGDNIRCMYDIIGVTSFGRGCAGGAGIYVRVSNYIKWIEDIVWP